MSYLILINIWEHIVLHLSFFLWAQNQKYIYKLSGGIYIGTKQDDNV